MRKKLTGVCLLFMMVLSSCEKNEMVQDLHPSRADKIKQSAKELSRNHDTWVMKMQLEENRMLQDLKKISPDLDPGLTDYLSVMEKVTGIRAQFQRNAYQVGAPFKVSADDGLPVINFDAQEIHLADYALTEQAQDYLIKLDDIMLDTIITIEDKVSAIEKLESMVTADENLEENELYSIFNATSIAKGSLQLWSGSSTKVNASAFDGLYKVNPLSKWSYLSKLGFVVAADAVGGVLGFWLGGYVVVNGIPLYVPPGPTGIAASAAGLSYIAAKMVGW